MSYVGLHASQVHPWLQISRTFPQLYSKDAFYFYLGCPLPGKGPDGLFRSKPIVLFLVSVRIRGVIYFLFNFGLKYSWVGLDLHCWVRWHNPVTRRSGIVNSFGFTLVSAQSVQKPNPSCI